LIHPACSLDVLSDHWIGAQEKRREEKRREEKRREEKRREEKRRENPLCSVDRLWPVKCVYRFKPFNLYLFNAY
jgi:hypothetical protein